MPASGWFIHHPISVVSLTRQLSSWPNVERVRATCVERTESHQVRLLVAQQSLQAILWAQSERVQDRCGRGNEARSAPGHHRSKGQRGWEKEEEGAVESSDHGEKKKKLVKPPPPDQYVVNHPYIAPMDTDIIKLTAQFVARNGQKFLMVGPSVKVEILSLTFWSQPMRSLDTSPL